MARHQVLQHRLVSCTSAIPHPFCQRHPKIQFRACVTSRAGSAFAPARRSRRLGIFALPLSRPPTPRVDARLIFDLNNSTTTETSILINTFFDTTPPPSEPLCRNGTTPTPACHNKTTPTPAWTKPSRSIPTLQVNYTHRYALRSPSIDTMRFFLDLHADGLSHSHSLSCFPSHKQEQS